MSIAPLIWRRDGVDWVLTAGSRRRMGRVVPDADYPGMYRRVLTGGRFSDMANLARAKDAVYAAAERDLEYIARQRANAPSFAA